MEDKIEVGDYVRTKYGIAKVEKVEVDKPHKTIWYTVDKPQYYCFLVRKQEVIKSSKNIINLIEEGDFLEILADGEPFRFEVDSIDYKHKLKNIGVNIKVKSIVTEEQLKQIEYLVEE